MASIDAKVRAPKVPEYLEAEVVGRASVMRLPLAAFSSDELHAVGAQWTQDLEDRANEQRENGAPAPRKRRSTKAPEGGV